MEKKFYLRPALRQIDLETESMLAGSPGGEGEEGDGIVVAPDAPWGSNQKRMWDDEGRGIWK